MLWSSFLIPDSSDPNDRDAENWLLLPLLLGAVAVAMGAVAVLAGVACVVRRERLTYRTVVPLSAGTVLTLLPLVWLTSLLVN